MTSRVLAIMRHAQAEQSEAYQDFDRPLTARGRSDAHQAGAWLAAEGYAPDLVICSTAVRARQTWHEVAMALATSTGGHGCDVQYEEGLYHEGMARALSLIRGVEPDVRAVLLVAHNPTMSALTSRLDGSPTRRETGLATAQIAVHEVIGAWADCASAPLLAVHAPRG